MKSKKLWALLLSITSFVIHSYLTIQHYSLKSLSNTGEASFCSINATFDCDAVALSSYASVFQIPVALLGAISHLFLVFLLLSYFISPVANPQKYIRLSFLVSTVMLVASVFMGGISLFLMTTYCILCIALYLLSFGVFELLRRELGGEFFKNIVTDFTSSFSVFMTLVIFLAVGYIFHKRHFRSIPTLEPSRIAQQWQRTSPSNFQKTTPIYSLGSSNPKMVIQEFLDFFCPSCKRSSHPVTSFVQAHKKDVRLDVYSLPLGVKKCEKSIPQPHCYLPQLVYCAQKEHQKGAILAKEFFEHQSALSPLRSDFKRLVEFTDTILSNLDIPSVKTCVSSQEAQDIINLHIQKSNEFELTGVPSFFINKKFIPNFTGVRVLKAIYETPSL